MVDIIAPIGLLLFGLGIITVFKDKVASSDHLTKMGIFSMIVAIIGYIFGLFEPVGMMISGISVIVLVMIIFLKVYTMIFGLIEDILIKLIFTGVFLTLVFQFLHIMNEQSEILLIGRNVSLAFALFCVLIKAFKLIFTKEDKEDSTVEDLNDVSQVEPEIEDELNDY